MRTRCWRSIRSRKLTARPSRSLEATPVLLPAARSSASGDRLVLVGDSLARHRLARGQERAQLGVGLVRRLLGRVVPAGKHPSAHIDSSLLPRLDRPKAAIDVATLAP